MAGNEQGKPIIGVTMGDPAGVGPEVIVRTLAHADLFAHCRPLVIGDLGVFEEACRTVGIPLVVNPVPGPGFARFRYGTLDLLDLANVVPLPRSSRSLPAATGKAAGQALETAARMALKGEIEGVVSAPVDEPLLRAAGYPYATQADLLAALAGARHYGQLLVAGQLRLARVSGHRVLRKAVEAITRSSVVAAIKLAHRGTRMMGIAQPRIGVAGLSLPGPERARAAKLEQTAILPAIAAATQAGMLVTGPLAPALLLPSVAAGRFDVLVSMYHAQTQVPLKGVSFNPQPARWAPPAGAVLVTVGLPIIHAAPHHGPGREIAGQGTASEQALRQALLLAALMARVRRQSP